MKWKIIYGCESRGDGDNPYLTRWTILEVFGCAVYLHKFHRSDNDDAFHDHPWGFISLPLWRGYIEERPSLHVESRSVTVAEGEALIKEGWHYRGYGVGDSMTVGRPSSDTRKKRVWPGMILFRPATWVHRVQLVDDRPAWSLILRGPYCREWGFIERVYGGWESFRAYFERNGC